MLRPSLFSLLLAAAAPVWAGTLTLDATSGRLVGAGTLTLGSTGQVVSGGTLTVNGGAVVMQNGGGVVTSNSWVTVAPDPGSWIFAAQILKSFTTQLEGLNPTALVADGEGRLVGVTSSGGAHNAGTLFSLTRRAPTLNFPPQPPPWDFALLHSFDGTDGGGSPTTLVRAADGSFYGTTRAGGAGSLGVVFHLATDGAFNVVASLGTELGSPAAALMQASDGALYGLTRGIHQFQWIGTFQIPPGPSFPQITLYRPIALFKVALTGSTGTIAKLADLAPTTAPSSGLNLSFSALLPAHRLIEDAAGNLVAAGRPGSTYAAGPFSPVLSRFAKDGAALSQNTLVAGPSELLRARDGFLYGVQRDGAELFRLTADGAPETIAIRGEEPAPGVKRSVLSLADGVGDSFHAVVRYSLTTLPLPGGEGVPPGLYLCRLTRAGQLVRLHALSTEPTLAHVDESGGVIAFRTGGEYTGSPGGLVLRMPTPENLPPVIVDDRYLSPTSTSLSPDGTSGVTFRYAMQVLANDFDPEGLPLTITAVSDPRISIEANGLLVLIGSGSATDIESFTYTVSDGRGTTSIGTVRFFNRPPVARNDVWPSSDFLAVNPYSTNGAVSSSFGEAAQASSSSSSSVVIISPPFYGARFATHLSPLGNDSDPDRDALFITGASRSDGGLVEILEGRMLRVPAASFSVDGPRYAIRYTISDGHGGTAMAGIFRNDVNGPPVAASDRVSLSGQSFAGGGLSGVIAPGEVAIGMAAGGPPGAAPALKTLTYHTLDVVRNDTDPEGEWLSLTEATLISGVSSHLEPASLQIIEGQLKVGFWAPIQPVVNPQPSAFRFSYTIADSRGATATGYAILGNRAPVAANDVATLDPRDGGAFGLPLANDADADGDPLRITSIGRPAHGTASVATDGRTLMYQPRNPAAFRSDVVRYTVADGFGATSSATVRIEHPFRGRPGVFEGLIGGANPTGWVRLALGAGRQFTGAFMLAGQRYAFSGEFGLDGKVYGSLSRENLLTLHVEFDLGFGDSTRSLRGIIAPVGENGLILGSEVLAFTADSLARPPADVAGNYTLSLPPDAAQPGRAYPQGAGFALMKVARDGSVRVSGRLGDHTPFSVGARVSEHRSFTLFHAPHTAWGVRHQRIAGGSFAPRLVRGPAGLLAGAVRFADAAASDCAGVLSWHKPATGGGLYPEGFRGRIELAGSRYDRAESGLFAGESMRFALSGGALREPSSLPATFSHRGEIAIVEPMQLSLAINAGTGLFRGTFRHAVTGEATGVMGAVLQKQTRGTGVFTARDESGSLTFEKR